MEPSEFQVLGEWSGRTLQEVLSLALSISKGTAKKLLDARSVFVNNKRIWMAKFKIKTGDRIAVHSYSAQKSFSGLETGSVLFEDDEFIVINKAAHILSNGGNSCETQIRKRYNDKKIRAVHRLDKDTSGCLIFARSEAAWEKMYELFKNRAIEKVYHVLCVGRYHGGERVINTPIDGKDASTKIKLVQQRGQICLLEAHIETGRTHQIRKHLLSVGLPVLGDRHYTSKRSESESFREVSRQMLHAYKLRFRHPTTQKKIEVSAPYPDDFKKYAKDA